MMKNLFSCLLILFSTFIYSQSDGIYEMVLYYPIDNHIHGNNIDDLSGYGTHGEMHNITLIEDRHGNPNGAIEFNGYNSYVRMNSPYFSKTAYCYSLWAKIYHVPTYGTAELMVCIGSDYAIDHFLMNTKNYSLNNHTGLLGGGYHKDSTHAYVRTQTDADVGVWQHITYMRNEEILKLYVNSELVATSTEDIGIPYFGDDFFGRLGCRSDNKQFFLGALDDIRIFERMVDEEEIDIIQNQDEIPKPFVEAGKDTTISNTEIQLTGKAYVFKSLEWSTSGDGSFSSSSIKEPIYYPGPNDISSEKPVRLILSAEGFDPNRSVVYDTVEVFFAPESGIGEKEISDYEIFPNPIRSNEQLFLSSKTKNLDDIASLRLIDLKGKVTIVPEVSNLNDKLISFKIPNIPRGIYILSTEENAFVGRIVVIAQ